MNCIGEVNPTLPHGLSPGRILFRPGLNLVCGENGTGKTQLLRFLRGYNRGPGADREQVNIQAVSPKRNSQRQAVQQVLQELRQKNKQMSTYIDNLGSHQINDNTFTDYASLAELFCLAHAQRCRDGTHQIDHMERLAREFDDVVSSAFTGYNIMAEWDDVVGGPKLSIRKHATVAVPPEGLSLGEQEVLSLVANLYISRDRFDVFLIDEPEVHLNWHLEERLFRYFCRFCEEYEKQLIVATHSRIALRRPFIERAVFLMWEGARIVNRPEPSADLRHRIAGEALEVLQIAGFPTLTVFVEDDFTKSVVEALVLGLGGEAQVVVCGNKQNVRSIRKAVVSDSSPGNVLFLEDGDNEESPFPGDDRFIHLDKYCIENLLLDEAVAARVTGKSQTELCEIWLICIKEKRDAILKKNAWLGFLLENLEATDLTPERMARLNAKEILPAFLERVQLDEQEYVREFVHVAIAEERAAEIFPRRLVATLREPRRTGAVVAAER